jgi:two-component system sensor histidine kinase ChvG
MSQVINNLLDNAISFSPANSTIRIVCGLDRKAKEVEIAIEDEGPGIPEGHLEKIFDRFYTDRPEQEGFGKNSGLGLNISRQIVTAHKGHIWAENRGPCPEATRICNDRPAHSSGARFVIRLPVI